MGRGREGGSHRPMGVLLRSTPSFSECLSFDVTADPHPCWTDDLQPQTTLQRVGSRTWHFRKLVLKVRCVSQNRYSILYYWELSHRRHPRIKCRLNCFKTSLNLKLGHAIKWQKRKGASWVQEIWKIKLHFISSCHPTPLPFHWEAGIFYPCEMALKDFKPICG